MEKLKDFHRSIIDKYGEKFLEKMQGRSIKDEISQWIIDRINKKVRGMHILETGRFKGYSLSLFNRFACDSTIVSVDPKMFPEAQTLINDFDDTNDIVIINGTSQNELPDLSWDIVLIDGDHSEKWARLDWNNIPNRESSDVVIFDDTNHKGGCGNVYFDIAKEYEHLEVGQSGIIFINGMD